MVTKNNTVEKSEMMAEMELLAELDKGIDDMEMGRILPHDEAMKKIREAVAYAI